METITFIGDLAAKPRTFTHYWEHTVGSGHATLALRNDWQQQLTRCHEELGFRYVRFHGILCDDVGTLVTEQGKPLYSFFNIDRIVDFLLSIGMKPFMELSFMPTTLASGHTTVFHYQGNVTPPAQPTRWAGLVRTLMSHLVARYGVREMQHWFFEVWNEPNLKAFWTGTQAQYFRLYRDTAHAIKGVNKSLRVGGPASAKNEWITEFVDFCEKQHVPLDFITTHHYPTDAFGNFSSDTEQQLAHSRRSILREEAQDACRRARGWPLYYTEWNTSSDPHDPRHDDPYAAAFVTKTIMEASGLVEGYSFWTFTDIFEENYFPSMPFHGGFGLLNLYGIPKPAYRAFELLHALGDQQLAVDGLHETVDTWIVRKRRTITVLITNHALPHHPIQVERVSVVLNHAVKPSGVRVERIDDRHANAKRRWEALGAPEYLDAGDVERLQQASSLQREPLRTRYADGTIQFDIAMPPQSVAAVTLEHASRT
jgi:xylan 1,4-beta-xylosidase